MTEKEKLEDYIGKGHQALTTRNVSEGEKKSKLPLHYSDKEVFAVQLRNLQTGEISTFYFTEEETKSYAKKMIEDGRTITGYKPCFYCTVTCADAISGGVDFTKVIENIKHTKRWDVKLSPHPNTIEIYFLIEGNDRNKLNDIWTEVEILLLALSLKNQVGFSISDYSEGAILKIQPAYKVGMQIRVLNGLDEKELTEVENLLQDENVYKIAEALNLIYSQVTDSSKITVGWSSIEELLNSSPEHILSDSEKQLLIEKIKELGFDAKKETKILTQLSDANIMASSNRNERIARNIANMTGTKYEEVIEKIRNLTRDRGKLAHTTSETPKINQHVEFIKKVLAAYYENKK